MLLTVAATAFTFTACNDDNDGDGKKPFESDLIGAYVPAMQPEDTQGIFLLLRHGKIPKMYRKWICPQFSSSRSESMYCLCLRVP